MRVQQVAFPVVWFVSSNSNLLGLDLCRNNRSVHGTVHGTDGVLKSIAVVAEGA